MVEQTINELYDEAKEQTLETLPAFLERIATMVTESWDYDTGIHAVAISAVAASWAMESIPSMGMSGSSANRVVWQYMIEYGNVKLPAKIIEYNRMLYPQYAAEFEKTITSYAWGKLQGIATERLRSTRKLHPNVRAHLQSIVDGILPFGYTLRD